MDNDKEKEVCPKTRERASGQALQNTRQANPTKLLAGWPSQYRMHGMLSNAGSAAPQQTSV
jgi:hypothetical protein